MNESAFGIEHGEVSKSFVPTSAASSARTRFTSRSGYVKAINLTKQERGRVKTNIARRKRIRQIIGTKVQGV